jgi:hypothetical protein
MGTSAVLQMKTWYRAVCDEHKEMCTFFCNNPLTTGLYMGDRNEDIHQWFSLHYACKLRMIHFDDDLDYLFKNNYVDAWE